MFNGSLTPFTNLTIRGVLFYQGENNSFLTGWKTYVPGLPALIADWRAAFGEPNEYVELNRQAVKLATGCVILVGADRHCVSVARSRLALAGGAH